MVSRINVIESVKIEYVMLCDWAENIGNKLYIQGGGWDRIVLPPSGQPISFAVAASVLVPWNHTNQEFRFVLSFEDGDGQTMNHIQGGFTVGRPAKAKPGQVMRSPFAARVSMPVKASGAYQVKLTINDELSESVAFYVVDKL